MKCRRPHCGHSRDSHNEFGRCCTQILTGWSEKEQRFTGQHPCSCTSYQGPAPEAAKVTPTDCPHEVQPDSKHPNRCVYCGKITSRPSKSQK